MSCVFCATHCGQVTRYLEFKTVDGSYVVKGSKINKVRYRDMERGCDLA